MEATAADAAKAPETIPIIIRNRWWTVFASMLGLIVAQGSISVFAFAVFLKPVTQDLGIGRGTFSLALTLGSVIAGLTSPAVGRLIDRRGIRPVLLAGIVCYAAATAAMGLMQSSPLIVYGLFAIAGLMSTTQLPIGYAKAINQRFDKERGLALGIAMAGVGLGVALIPQLAGRLIQDHGWRWAYVGLGITIFVLAFAPVAAFIRDVRPNERTQLSAEQRMRSEPGLIAGDVLKGSRQFWFLVITFLFVTTAINGTLTHVVALLTDRGIPAQVAVGALSGAGLALIAGRILAGFLLDRIFGRYVAIFFFVCPMIGIGLLATNLGGAVPFAGTLLCGLGIGAELDFMAFFVSRYFGLKAFGEIYGYIVSTLVIGSGLGPYLMGVSFDAIHSYRPTLIAFEVLLGVSCVLIAQLGPYRFPARSATGA